MKGLLRGGDVLYHKTSLVSKESLLKMIKTGGKKKKKKHLKSGGEC